MAGDCSDGAGHESACDRRRRGRSGNGKGAVNRGVHAAGPLAVALMRSSAAGKARAGGCDVIGAEPPARRLAFYACCRRTISVIQIGAYGEVQFGGVG
jgi:hypothetical protein